MFRYVLREIMFIVFVVTSPRLQSLEKEEHEVLLRQRDITSQLNKQKVLITAYIAFVMLF